MSHVSRLGAYVVALGVCVFSLPAVAGMFPEPVGEVVLTIDGNLGPDTPSGGYVLDMAGLLSLPATSFETTTIWTDGVQKFTGVSMRQLLDMVGAEGTIVLAEALNGYVIEIPIADLDQDAPILAYHLNGEEFSRRDKGPLWIVYPYDLEEKYKSELTYANSVWQLQKLTVR